MSTDIVIGQTLDLDTGQDVLDLGSSFVFNPVQKTPPLPDPPDGLHDSSSRGGDDGEEIGGHENDTEHKEDYENCEVSNDDYEDYYETDQNCGDCDCCPICLNCCFYAGQIGCKTQYYRISCLIKNIPTIIEKPPREDLKLENPCQRSSHIQPSNSASSSQGHLSPSQATPTLGATTMEATAWSALVAMMGTLLVIVRGKNIKYLLTVLLYFVGSGGLHSYSSIYWEYQVQINTRSDTLFYSSQPWMKAVAEPHYLKRVRVRVRNEEEVHNVHVPRKLQEASDAISRKNTSKFNMVWQPGRQPDHSSADLLSDQEDPNPWSQAALNTTEAKQSAKEAGELNEDMQTVPPLVTSLGAKSLIHKAFHCSTGGYWVGRWLFPSLFSLRILGGVQFRWLVPADSRIAPLFFNGENLSRVFPSLSIEPPFSIWLLSPFQVYITLGGRGYQNHESSDTCSSEPEQLNQHELCFLFTYKFKTQLNGPKSSS